MTPVTHELSVSSVPAPASPWPSQPLGEWLDSSHELRSGLFMQELANGQEPLPVAALAPAH